MINDDDGGILWNELGRGFISSSSFSVIIDSLLDTSFLKPSFLLITDVFLPLDSFAVSFDRLGEMKRVKYRLTD